MPKIVGSASKAKMVLIKPQDIEGDVRLYALSSRQANALLTLSTMLEWRTRYTSIPSDISSEDEFDRWVNETKFRLMNPLDFEPMTCEEQKLCLMSLLSSDDDVKGLLNDFFDDLFDKRVDELRQTLPEEYTKNIIEELTDCNPDELYGKIVRMIEYIHDTVMDFLEEWETYTNGVEVVGALSELPFLDEIGLDAIFSYAQDITDSVKEAFETDYSVAWLEDRSCEIFCSLKDNCEVSIEDLANFFADKVSSQISLSNVVELFQSLIDLDIEGFNVADAYFAFFFGALKIANLIIPIEFGIEKFFKLIRMFDEPNNDWEVLCEDCSDDETPMNCSNLKIDNSLWTPAQGNYAIWVDGSGYKRGGTNSRINLRTNVTIPQIITEMEFTFNQAKNYMIGVGYGSTSYTYYNIAASVCHVVLSTPIPANQSVKINIFEYGGTTIGSTVFLESICYI